MNPAFPFFKPATLDREELLCFLEHVDREARPRPVFYGLVFLASVIATFGLLANSASVIIGAMLIAPLMNAIVGVALAVVLDEQELMRRSSLALVTGALLAFSTGMVLAWASPVVEPGSEILARVRPTTFDLWVALAAGVAGAYSLLRARASAALPGVAIATAVVPPLVTAGVEARLLDLGGAVGAFLLFGSNLVAIACGSILVFAYYGLSRLRVGDEHPFRRYAWWSGSFVLMLVVLSHSLAQVARETRTRAETRRTLENQLKMVPGAMLDKFDLRYARDGIHINAVVATPNSIGPPMVAAAERLLSSRLGEPAFLVVRSVITKDADAHEYRTAAEETTKEPPQTEGTLATVERILREQALALENASLYDYSVTRQPNGLRVSALYRSPYQVDPLVTRGIRNLLSDALGRPVDLRLNVIPPDFAPPLLPREEPPEANSDSPSSP